MNTPDDWLLNLQSAYRNSLKAKLEQLGELCRRLTLTPDDPAIRLELWNAVHRLHGSAGSYGFMPLSRIARDWEAALEADAEQMPGSTGRNLEFLQALLKEADMAPAPAGRAAQPPAGPGAEARRVMVVDDDPDITAFLTALLRAEGYRAESAASADKALRRLLAFQPDLIIADVYMPGLNGYELCRLVRAMGFDDIPFFFHTALDANPLRIEGLRCGADDYFVKPVDADELRIKVRKQMERVRRPRQPGKEPGFMHGDLAEVGPSLLLQIIGMRDEGAILLCLEQQGKSGMIYFQDSNPVHAELDGCVGAKAFFRLLGWNSGMFRLERVPWKGKHSLTGSLERWLLEGMRHLDESRRLLHRLGNVTPGPAAGAAPHTLPREARHLLGEFQAGRSLTQALDASPLPDLEVLRHIADLVEVGVLKSERKPPVRGAESHSVLELHSQQA